MGVIFLFVDGVGLGGKGEENPLAQRELWGGMKAMAAGQPMTIEAEEIYDGEHLFKGIDATLGVEGLPQSGTGQTTLFTGVNAAESIGKHFGPFPHSGIKKYLKEDSLFVKAERRGRKARFLNAYPDIFFKKAEQRNRWSCTTLMTKSAGIPLYTKKDVLEGRAVTAEITQQVWRERLKENVPEIEVGEAARRVLEAAEKTDLVLYEYYLTDKAGHSRDRQQAAEVLGRLDAFISYILKGRGDGDTVILTSDHGNVEDLSVKTHTLNRVPLAVVGPGALAFEEVESIQGITPAILKAL